MEGESLETQAERIYNALHYILMAKLPRFTGFNEPHPYATGRLLKGMYTVKTDYGWRIIISKDVPYSSIALGFNEDGSKRMPRGKHEAHNFNIVETCIDLMNKLAGGNYVSKK